jgi:hypothetical protein
VARRSADRVAHRGGPRWPCIALHAWTVMPCRPGLVPGVGDTHARRPAVYRVCRAHGRRNRDERRWFRVACNGLFGRYWPRLAAEEMVP